MIDSTNTGHNDLSAPLGGQGAGQGAGAILEKYFSDFSEKQLGQFRALDGLYKEWNAMINVISRKDIDALYEKHVLHSLAIAATFPFRDGLEIIDIGTGGGFPGVPLAIFFPNVRFHLVDSIGKKLKIIEAVKEAIGLTNVTTQHSRAEEIKDRKFDFAVSRAVAPLGDLLRWSRPLLRKTEFTVEDADGTPTVYKSGLVCLKGGDLALELNESGARTRPRAVEISRIFEEPWFAGKYVIYAQ